MNAEVIIAVAVPTGVVVGWLTKHLQNGGKPTGHQARIEALLSNIEKHTSEIPLLKQVLEQHEQATARSREQLAEMAADMKSRQRRGE